MADGYSLRALILENERCPFADWYQSLRDMRTRAVIAARLARIQGGNLGDAKSVGGVFEFRIDFGPGYRLYFAQLQETLPDDQTRQTVIVLLVGGDKGTQPDDIARAQTLWQENKNDVERYAGNFAG